MSGGPPDFELMLVSKDRNAGGKRSYTRVGAGWSQFGDGTVSVRLNPGTILDHQLMKEFYLNLRPVNSQSSQSSGSGGSGGSNSGNPDDDIPF